jgi:single-strand DNA-binding protein
MLRVDVIGNLGGDPHVTVTQKGKELVQLSVAVNQVRTDQNGQRQETTQWLRIRAMNNQAERAKTLTRGSRVFVAGRLDISHYTSRDGEPKTGYDVWADEIANLTPRPPAEDGREPSGVAATGGSARDAAVYDPEGDLPF